MRSNYKVAIIITFLIIVVLGHHYNHLIEKNSTVIKSQQQLNDLINQSDNITYVFVGTSHTRYGLQTYQLNNSFNLAIPGMTLKEAYARLKYIYASGTNISTALVEIDPFFINGYNQKHLKYVELYDEYQQRQHLLDSKDIISQIKLFQKVHYNLLGSGIMYISYIKQDILNNTAFNETMNRGYISSDRQGNNFKEHAINRIRMQYNEDNINLITDDALRHLDEMISLLNEHDTEIIFYTTPMHDEYSKVQLSKGFNKSEFYSVIIPTYGEYRYIDGASLQLNDSHFKDSDHLNRYGAEITTRYIIKNLNSTVRLVDVI